ncbi:MAG TPA: hypothetical protein VJT67_07835 [Longimicrobiaceae bacterium]|nr:hypothetical protein [Longimicrobiaceae bacterium]
MTRIAHFAKLALALALLFPWPAAAQARGTAARNQAAVEAGYLAFGLSYARRLGDGPLSVGGGARVAWEPPNSFDRNLFEPIGADVFVRWRASRWVHADVGPTLARYHYADDCPACTGTLTGLRSGLLFGQGIVFVGPELTAGWARDRVNGSEFGVVYGGQVRVVIGWGG